MKYTTLLTLSALCITTACSSDGDPFLNELEAQGGQYTITASEWKAAMERVEEGTELVDDGKDQIAEGRELIDEGENTIEQGRRLIQEGERMKARIEAAYIRTQQTAPTYGVPTVPYPGY